MVNSSVVPSLNCALENGTEITKFSQIVVKRKVASFPGLKGNSWEEAWTGKQEQGTAAGE